MTEFTVGQALVYTGPRPAKDVPTWMTQLVSFRGTSWSVPGVEVFTTDGSRWVQPEHVAPADEPGWCAAHQDVHGRRPSCTEFESDQDFTARLIAESAEHDRHNAGRTEARYVAEYRPY